MDNSLEAPDTGEEPEVDECSTAEYWTKEFAAAKRWFSKFHSLARRIEKSYLLESPKDDDDTEVPAARYNLFWSNVETILAALYGRLPKVEVDRTNLDPDDDIARVAGLILERIFNLEFTNVEDSPYYVFQEALLDRCVAGMGIAWARYEYKEGVQQITPEAVEGMPAPEPVDVPIITDEMAPLDYVNWEDFLYSPCKRWQDKRWVARRVPMCKSEVAEHFDATIAGKIPYNLKASKTATEDPDKARVENQADIWEIWNLYTRTAYWYVPGYTDLIQTKADPLKLEGFWPCKRPLMATCLPKKFLPRPDFLYAHSQYAELNLIVQRCQMLTEALRVTGVYDKTADGVQRMLDGGSMNKMIPVDNWAMFAEKGGIKGAVDWFPLEMVMNTLDKLVQRKQLLVVEVYEILGISDIQRGQATTKETATTQRLKAQFGSARTDLRINAVARFITDHTRLRAEIICKHWQAETIMERSQIDKTPDAQYANAAIAFLKGDPSVATRLTVSADTIAAPDWDLEKQQRVDFLQAISQFIGMMWPLIEKDPSVGPYAVRIIQWASTGFKGAKQIEGVLDQAYQALLVSSQQPKQPDAEQKLKEAQAEKAAAEARLTNLEAALAAAGFDMASLQALAAVPPPLEGTQTSSPSTLPGSGGMAPPRSIPPNPSIPRPGVQ